MFLLAKETIQIKTNDGPIIAHGAGSWLIGDKATKFESSNPGKSLQRNWTSDEFPVVLEECFV